MKGDVDPCVRVGVLSASSLPRSGGGTEASSWVVEAKVLKRDKDDAEEELYRTKPSRLGTWNEELIIPLDAGDPQPGVLQLVVLDATLREKGWKACTFQLRDFIPWNGYHLDVHMGRDIRLRVSVLVALGDPGVKIQHMLRLKELLLAFPEGMPLPGVRREAGAAVKAYIQCIPKGTEGEASMLISKTKEPPPQCWDAADEEAIELGALRADRNEGNSYLRSTVPVTILENQVAWNESTTFPLGPRVKKSYMAHTRAYPRQLYGIGEEWNICQVSFFVSFFLVEAASQSSSPLGFAVLEIPDDVRLSDGEVAELSADVTSPEGKTLEDVCCVVDLEVSGPAPRPSREEGASSADDDDDRSDVTTSSTEGSDSRSESLPGSRLSSLSKSSSESSGKNSDRRRGSSPNSKARRESIERQLTAHAEAEKELQSQIISLHDQLEAAQVLADRKQIMVDNLSEQVNKRSDAIKKCGTEIVKLRKHIEDIDQERHRLRSQLKTLHRTTAEAEMEANRVMKVMEGGNPPEGLIGENGGRHTRALAKRCIVLTEENRTLRKVAQDSAQERWQAAVLKSEMEKMKKTQHVQAVYIRKMQALPGKVAAYKSTVGMQEKVIAKLETLLAGRRPGNSGGAVGEEEASMVGRRHGSSSETDRLRKENAALRWKLAMAGANNSGSLQGQVADDASVMLKMKESKIRILEEQMVANAKSSGDEIAVLQMRIMEMEFEMGDS